MLYIPGFTNSAIHFHPSSYIVFMFELTINQIIKRIVLGKISKN